MVKMAKAGFKVREVECEHPDIKIAERRTSEYIRENLYSPKDPHCIQCGKKCK